MRKLSVIFFFLSASVLGQKYTLKVKIEGFENSNGKLFFQLQNSSEKAIYQSIETIKDKTVEVELKDVVKGKYSVRVFHDENNNKKLDKNLVGFPTEGWGLSNNVKAILGPPKFEDSLFELNGDKEIRIRLQ